MRRVLRFVDHHRPRVRAGVPIELRKDRGTLQLSAGTRFLQWDRLAPGFCVALINQLRYGNLREVGIAHELSAIEKRPLEGLGCQVNARCRAVAQLAQIVAFEDVEDLYQRHTSRGRRRRADDVVATIRAADWLPLFYVIRSQVLGSHQSSAL